MTKFTEFQKDSGVVYPPFSKIYFEKYFFNYMQKHTEMSKYYIPIFWTENQISVWNKEKQNNRQAVINTLNKNKKYFTIVQHDDGITHTQLPNIYIFGMGGVGHIPLPLTYENKELFMKYKDVPKTIFCSFMGSLTHPCRLESCKQLHNKPGVVLKVNGWTNTIPENNQQQFIDIMSKSRFTLAPRGYGKSSFRMYEAFHLKSIPVYVYDEPWLPYTELIDWKRMAVLIHVRDIPTMYETLTKISDKDVEEMITYYEQHKHLFTYDGMCEYIIKKVPELLSL